MSSALLIFENLTLSMEQSIAASPMVEITMNFSAINLEVIDINTNAPLDIFVNANGITFNKRVLEDMNYPQTVQYCLDATQHIFAIRVCKSNESRATLFSKAKAEQTTTLSCNSKNLKEVVANTIPNFKPDNHFDRYLSKDY